MKKSIWIFVCVVLAGACLAGCQKDSGSGNAAPTPAPSMSGDRFPAF